MTGRAVRLGHLAQVDLGKMLQPTARSEADLAFPYLRAAHVQPNGQIVDLGVEQTMWFSPVERTHLALRIGDVVVVEGGAGYGRSALVDGSISGWPFQNSIIRVRPRPRALHPGFLNYHLQSDLMQGRISLTANTATIPHFTAEKVRAHSIALLPIAEQRVIADFLDRETAKIDALIEKQTELIALLQERRTAVILAGVTGARTSERQPAQMGWVDTAPASWDVIPIDYAAQVTLGKMVASTAGTEKGTLAPYLRAANVQPDGKTAFDDLKEMWFEPSELESLTVRAGDVVVVEGGQGGFGRAAFVRNDLPGVGFQNSINRLRPIAGDGRFLTYALVAVRATGYMHVYCDVVSMPHLTSEKLSRLRIAAPAPAEQREIADYLDRETAKIDTLITKAERFIELARERRSVLITAAVTGQIDVTEGAA